MIAHNQAKIDAKLFTLATRFASPASTPAEGDDKMCHYDALLGAVGFSLLLFSVSHGQTPAPIISKPGLWCPRWHPNRSRPRKGRKLNQPCNSLERLLATSAATIKKQETALATLDELQKASEEIKIFSNASYDRRPLIR